MMAKRKIYVTGAQVDAARMLVEHGNANGKPASQAIHKIANATTRPEAETEPSSREDKDD